MGQKLFMLMVAVGIILMIVGLVLFMNTANSLV